MRRDGLFFCIKTLSIFCDWMMLRVVKPSASRRAYQRVSVLCDFIFLWWLEGSDVTAKADFCFFFFKVTLGGKPFYQKYYCTPKFDSKCPLWKIFLPSIKEFPGNKNSFFGPFTVSWPGPLHLPIRSVFWLGTLVDLTPPWRHPRTSNTHAETSSMFLVGGFSPTNPFEKIFLSRLPTAPKCRASNVSGCWLQWVDVPFARKRPQQQLLGLKVQGHPVAPEGGWGGL